MKRIVVTAGASGIGKAMAETFLQAGASVAICDIDGVAIAAFADAHSDSIAVKADVTSEAEMEAFFDQVEAAWQAGPTVLCANAGTGGQAGAVDTLDLTQWRSCISVNLDGAFLPIRWAARHMKSDGEGLIILTSSTAGLMGYANRTPYAAAKWGMIGMMKSLAIELGPAGIRVNALCPGMVSGERAERIVKQEAQVSGISEEQARQVYSEGVSLRTWVDPEEIAAMAAYLDSPMGRKISGQAIAVDGHTETLSR